VVYSALPGRTGTSSNILPHHVDQQVDSSCTWFVLHSDHQQPPVEIPPSRPTPEAQKISRPAVKSSCTPVTNLPADDMTVLQSGHLYTDRQTDTSAIYHGLRGSASPVLTATGLVNGKCQILTPYRIEATN